MIAEYSFILRDKNAAQYRRDITGLVVGSDMLRVVNAVGTEDLVLVPGVEDLLHEDARLYLYQTLPGRTPELIAETWYLLRRVKRTESAEGEVLYHLRFVDLNDLLDTRIIAYAAGEPESDKADPADDMLKAFVRENLGALASDYAGDTTRRINPAIFSVQADTSTLAIMEKTAPWRQLMLVLQEIADMSIQRQTPVFFDVVATSETTCEFRVYVGQRGRDRRAGAGRTGGFILSPERQNFINPEYVQDWTDECTYAYAGGQGEGTAREIQPASEALRIQKSPFNRRERFVDARQTDNSDAVRSEAFARVFEGRPRHFVKGEVRETDQSLFQLHFGFGDYITVQMRGLQADTRLNAVGLKIQRARTGDSFSRTLSIIAQVNPAIGEPLGVTQPRILRITQGFTGANAGVWVWDQTLGTDTLYNTGLPGVSDGVTVYWRQIVADDIDSRKWLLIGNTINYDELYAQSGTNFYMADGVTHALWYTDTNGASFSPVACAAVGVSPLAHIKSIALAGGVAFLCGESSAGAWVWRGVPTTTLSIIGPNALLGDFLQIVPGADGDAVIVEIPGPGYGHLIRLLAGSTTFTDIAGDSLFYVFGDMQPAPSRAFLGTTYNGANVAEPMRATPDYRGSTEVTLATIAARSSGGLIPVSSSEYGFYYGDVSGGLYRIVNPFGASIRTTIMGAPTFGHVRAARQNRHSIGAMSGSSVWIASDGVTFNEIVYPAVLASGNDLRGWCEVIDG